MQYTPEAKEARESSGEIMDAFLREALPAASQAVRTLAGDLLSTTLGAVGALTSDPQAPTERVARSVSKALGRNH